LEITSRRGFRSNRSNFLLFLRMFLEHKRQQTLDGYCAKLRKNHFGCLLSQWGDNDLPSTTTFTQPHFTSNSISLCHIGPKKCVGTQALSEWSASSQRNTNTTITKRVLCLIPPPDKVRFAIFALEHGFQKKRVRRRTGGKPIGTRLFQTKYPYT
jgi:hypothetical protein